MGKWVDRACFNCSHCNRYVKSGFDVNSGLDINRGFDNEIGRLLLDEVEFMGVGSIGACVLSCCKLRSGGDMGA